MINPLNSSSHEGSVVSACSHSRGGGTVLFPARDYISGDLFQVVRCKSCGLVFTDPQPKEWSRFYPAGYYGPRESSRFPRLVEALQDWLYATRIRTIQHMNGGVPGRVLDIGCGRGLLLRQFQKRGWEVQGTELDDKAAAFGRDVLRLQVKTGSLMDMGFADGEFDAVVMWHVLEHVPEIEKLLGEVARVLKPGGVFLVAVPNFGSLEARVSKNSWFHLDVPRHLNHFTKSVLLEKLRATGLPAQKCSYFAPEYDLFSFVQSTLNRIGLRHNLLYNILRRGSAKVLGGEKPSILQTLLTLILVPPLMFTGIVVTAVAGLVEQGATMTIVARKTR